MRATALALVAVLTACGGDDAPGPAPDVGRESARVVRIVDGDTIRVTVAGREDRVRLIGIDAPEVDGKECFAAEATAELTRLLGEGEVRMQRQRRDRDRFDRLLRDVYRAGDGLFVNAELVRTGHARVLEVKPDVAHATEMRRFEADARAAGRGLWGACR